MSCPLLTIARAKQPRLTDHPIISSCYRVNAELSRTVSALRAEQLQLKGSHFKLECENAALRAELISAEQRERDLRAAAQGARHTRGLGMDEEQVEVRVLLLGVLLTALTSSVIVGDAPVTGQRYRYPARLRIHTPRTHRRSSQLCRVITCHSCAFTRPSFEQRELTFPSPMQLPHRPPPPLQAGAPLPPSHSAATFQSQDDAR